ncbi:MAG: hypothetical protein WBB29_19410 [Geitlerinemataceae cyanobacterium]
MLRLNLLDTDRCSFILEGEAAASENFRRRVNLTIATSVIVAGALKFMVQNSQRQAVNLHIRNQDFAVIDTLAANRKAV